MNEKHDLKIDVGENVVNSVIGGQHLSIRVEVVCGEYIFVIGICRMSRVSSNEEHRRLEI